VHLILHRVRVAAAGEGGFAMVAVLMVLLVGSLVAAAAVAQTNGDKPVAALDKERKQAYAAAEAGVNDYLARLVSNVDYWRKCGTDPANGSLNQRIVTAADEASRNWMSVPDAPDAKFSVEVLPANGKSQCDPSDPQGSYIDTNTGTFRIRATGRVRSTGDKRSIIATFKRRGFLDYVYFTDYETSAPRWFVRNSRGQNTRLEGQTSPPYTDVLTWADQNCVKYYRNGGQRATYNGERQTGANSWTDMDVTCGEIQFVTGDSQNGPFHTNDEILVCGTPKFGRNPSDDIEISAPDGTAGGVGSSSGWRNCGNGAPSVNDPTTSPKNTSLGVWRKGSPLVPMPPSNVSLKNEALPQYRFKGLVKLKMEGTKLRNVGTAPAKRENGTQLAANATMDLPNNGVVFVANDPASACDYYNPIDADLANTGGCGDLWIQGDYNYSVTFGAENDIVIQNNVTRDDTDDVMLGLIAKQWIRVIHPVSGTYPYDSCSNATGSVSDIQIEAALLALNQSFTVDRYWCGAKLGNLNITGAIAQKFRGPVGTSGNTGYFKNYTYDNRLRFRTPPKFLDPVQASWKIQNQVEQVPAT
jgi:hypothetical protein